MYTIIYYPISKISSLENCWRMLEKGKDMTFFQHYEWYHMLASKNSSIKHPCFEIVIAEVKKEESTILIAPLWIVKKNFAKFNKKGVYIFRRAQWSDYLIFVYKHFEPSAVDELLDNIKQKFGVSNFKFEDIPTYTGLFQYLNARYTHIEDIGSVCVELCIPDNIESYKKMLSKKSRQNIRTAFNRAEKDGVQFTFNFDDKDIDISAFDDYRKIRLNNKVKTGRETIKGKLIYFISTKILRRGLFNFAEYTPYSDVKNSHFITCKDQNGILCASFCYGIDKYHNKIVLMAVSTNPDYYKYSPGILSIYKFVIEQIEQNGFSSVDFTRGNERYKYVLGGHEHYNQNLEFSI